MPVKTEDGSPFHDHNLLNLNNTNLITAVNNPSNIGTSIKGMEIITADEAEFKTMHVEGDLDVNGKIRANQIEMSETQIILSIDYDRITEHMSHMDSGELNFFIKHLHKLKLMAEKELLDRS